MWWNTKTQERLRRESSEKIILAGAATRKPYDFKMFRANEDNNKQLCHLPLWAWSAQQAASRLEIIKMAVLIVEGKARHLISLNDELSWKSVLLLLLLLHLNYHIILIDQIDFTVSIITSAFKYQWPFVIQVELRELATIYRNQQVIDTRMGLYIHRAAALAWIQERSSQNHWHIYLRDSTLPRPRHQASWLYTMILGQGNIDN